MQNRVVRAYAHGHDGLWEAICVDLDIAVQGESFEEVRAKLGNAIDGYVEDVKRLSPSDAHRLLNRRAPIWVGLKFALVFLWHSFRAPRRNELQAGFDIPCHA